MRSRIAKLLAVATGAIVVALALVFATAGRGGADEAPQAPDEQPQIVPRGKVVYDEQRCSACHSIEGVGNRRYPLDGVGGKLNGADIRKWIVSPREMNPSVSKRAYDKLPPGDLDALVAYLQQLRQK